MPECHLCKIVSPISTYASALIGDAIMLLTATTYINNRRLRRELPVGRARQRYWHT